MTKRKKFLIQIIALVLNAVILTGALNLSIFAQSSLDDNASIEKQVEESIIEMLQTSPTVYSEEDSTFVLANSNVEISDDYPLESAYISEVDASTYEKLQAENEAPALYTTADDPYPGDDMVYLTQKWLNQEYGNVPGFGSVPENGRTGWDTVYGLLRALQHELGITDLANSFGSTTSSLYSQNLLQRNDGATDKKYAILQGALWCKGYDPGHSIHDNNGEISFEAVFDASVENAVIQLKEDAGLTNPDGVVTLSVMKALMSMDSFKLLPSYYGSDANVRNFQQKLNRKYEAYIGLVPCDGVYGRNTNRALIYALQAEEGLPVGTANGNFGSTTLACCPEIPYVANASAAKRYPGDNTSSYYTNAQIASLTELVQFALYVNGFGNGTFNGIFDTNTRQNLRDFQKHHAIEITGRADRDTWLSLFISKGNTERAALGADCATILNQAKAQTLYDNGYRYIGRYLTGTAGGISKALTREEANIILNTGLRFFPIYQTSANNLNYFTPEKGSADAEAAIAAATALGIPKDTIIYFAVDFDALDGNITSHIIPYFEKIHEVMSQSIYRTGVYGTRNVCNRVSALGYACSSFVSDMSTGYSGNLGFRLPDNWAFDQFANLEDENALGEGDGRIEIDKDAVSGRDQGVGKLDAVSDISVSESDFNIGSTDSATLTGPTINILGYEFPLFEFDINFDTPVADLEINIDNKNKTVQVLTGVDIYEGSSESLGASAKEQKYKEKYSNIKNLVGSIGKSKQEFEKNFRNMKGSLNYKRTKTVFDMDTAFVMYMTFDLETGGLMEGGGALIGTTGFSYSFPTGIPCIYFKFRIEGSIEAGLKIVLNEDTLKYDLSGETRFSVKPSVGVSADVLVASAYAGLSGELACELRTPFKSFQDSFEAELNASLFFEYNALLWGRKYEWTFSNTVLYPPSNSKSQSLSMSEDDLEFIEPLPQATAMAANSNPDAFKNNMQVYCKPQIAALGNGHLFMTYIDDAQNRTAENRTILMYSVFDGTSWSSPLPVLDDGTVDFEPVLCPDGNNGVHILWQNGTELFNESVTQEDMETKIDLQYIHWNGSSFEDNTVITSNNQNFEMQHRIAASGNTISVMWTQNSENDSLLLSGTNSIFRKQFNGTSWQGTETLASGLPFINSLDTSYDGTNNVFAYTTKTSNDSSTINDLEVFYNNGTQTLKITDDDLPDYSVKLLGDEIYWISDNSIVYTTNDLLSSIEWIAEDIGAGVSNFEVIHNTFDNKSIVWAQNGDSGVNFYGADYNATTNAFDSLKPLTMRSGVIRGWDACMLPNGQIELAYGFAEKLADPSDEEYYGTISLIQETVNQYSNIYVEPSIAYDGNINTGETITLYANIYNSGSLPVNQFDVEIYDQNNNLVQSNTLTESSIGVGESAEIAIPFTLPTITTRSDYKIKVTADNEEMSLLSDNEAIFSVGFADLVIDSVTETQSNNTRQLEVIIKNQGHSPVDTAILKLLDGSIDGSVVNSESITQLAPGNTKTFIFALPEENFDPEVSESARTYYLTIETPAEEYDSNNNTQEVQIYPNYLISLTAGEGGTVTGPATAVKDTNITVTAVPSTGYIFEGWYENGNLLYGIPATYSFMATSNRSLEAKFKPNDLTISEIEVFGSCNVDDSLVFTAYANGGTQPLSWSFEIKDETGTVYYTNTDALDNFFEWTPTAAKKYIVTAYCTDDSGYEVNYSTTFTVYDILDSGTCGPNATWALDQFGVLRISGTGSMDGYSTRDEIFAPWWDYHDVVNTIIIEDGITSIGDRAFEGYWPQLSSVTISNSVTEIRGYAFYAAGNVRRIVIPDSVTSIGYSAFREAGVEKLSIGTGVESISDLAFKDCFLTNVYIPESVVSIGGGAFSCSNLRSATILNPNANIRNDTFADLGNALTIYGYANSTAQACASSNGYKFSQISTEEAMNQIVEEEWQLYLEEVLPANPTSWAYGERTLIVADNGQTLAPADRYYVYKIHTTFGPSAYFTSIRLEEKLQNSYYEVMGESVSITVLDGYEEALQQYKLEGDGCSVSNVYRLYIQRGAGKYEVDVEIVVHKEL